MRGDIAPCPECLGDEHHAPGCTLDRRHGAYWQGYRHGRRIAENSDGHDFEPTLREDLHVAVSTDRYRTAAARAFALGELRGYRSARP